jgi:redox-sensitive bicupin YhaK (pirin superfamily)
VVATHEFSFGEHYAPDRIRFGPLVAHNVETPQPGCGYEPHLHRDVEIVTWLAAGVLLHDDDHGHAVRLQAPAVQRLTAASGVTHSELNAEPATQPQRTCFVQMWLDCPPDVLAAGEGPSHASMPVAREQLGAHLVAVASGPDTGVVAPLITLRSPGVTLLVGDIPTGSSRSLPDTALLHVHVVSGEVRLRTHEAVRAGDSLTIVSPRAEHVIAAADSQIVVLAMDQRPEEDVDLSPRR